MLAPCLSYAWGIILEPAISVGFGSWEGSWYNSTHNIIPRGDLFKYEASTRIIAIHKNIFAGVDIGHNRSSVKLKSDESGKLPSFQSKAKFSTNYADLVVGVALFKGMYTLWYAHNVAADISLKNGFDSDDTYKLEIDSKKTFGLGHLISAHTMIFFTLQFVDYKTYQTESYTSRFENSTSVNIGVSFPFSF